MVSWFGIIRFQGFSYPRFWKLFLESGWIDLNQESILLIVAILIGTLMIVTLWNVILRRQVQDQLRILRAKENQFSTLVNSMDDVIFTLDKNLRHTAVFGSWVKRAGADPVDFLGRSAEDIFGVEGGAVHREAGMRALLGGNVVYEWQAAGPDGMRYYQTSLSPLVGDRGEVTGLVGVGREITTLKQSAAALSQSEERYRGLFNSILDAIYIMDEHGYILDVNESAALLTRTERSSLIGKSLLDLSAIEKNNPAYILDLIKQAHQGVTKKFEFWAVRSFGEEFLSEVRVQNGIYFGEIVVIAIARDITEGKKHEIALSESESRFRSVVEQSTDGIVIVDEDGRISEFNHANERISGLNREEVIGKYLWDLQLMMLPSEERTPQRAERIRDTIQAALLTGKSPIFDHVMDAVRHKADGTKAAVQQSVFPIKTSKGYRIGSFVRDVTTQKKIEHELREREAQLRAIFNAIPDLVFLFDREGTYLEIHAPDPSLLIAPPEDFLGKKLKDVIPQNKREEHLAAFSKAVETGKTQMMEYQMPVQEGMRYFEARLAVMNENRLVNVVRDVTDRKLAEDLLKASLHEKEMLLKEIHHRVKNNMQVMVSLLSLQSNLIEDPQALAVFQDSKERIYAMSLVHEKLYQSADLARVNFSDYLNELILRLMEIFLISSDVSVEVEADDVGLGIDTAIPCGLIVNELVSNALKYAYPKGTAGKVMVNFHRVASTENDSTVQSYQLVVEDFGVGLPPEFDPLNSSTLGLQLVKVLTGQLRGTLMIRRENGLAFEIEFSEKGT